MRLHPGLKWKRPLVFLLNQCVFSLMIPVSKNQGVKSLVEEDKLSGYFRSATWQFSVMNSRHFPSPDQLSSGARDAIALSKSVGSRVAAVVEELTRSALFWCCSRSVSKRRQSLANFLYSLRISGYQLKAGHLG
jgi:hypothetical protein